MNILIISTQNPLKTSGIVALNLYQGFKADGHTAKLLIREYGKYDSEDIVSMETSTDEKIKFWKDKFIFWDNKLAKKFNRSSFFNNRVITNPNYYIQDYDQTKEIYSTKEIVKKIQFKPDAIIYLFQQSFLTAKNLFELNKVTGAKIFWYLMDTAPLTGGCHYSWDCEGYKNGCGNCPALYSSNKDDQSAINFRYKFEYLSKTDISIISPTEWQHKKAIESLLFKNKPISKVLLSIDSTEYNYLSKTKGKEKLGISAEKKVVFFGATSINHTRKGMKYLIEALEIMKRNGNLVHEDILLLIAGELDTTQISFPFEYRELGMLKNNEDLVAIYHAATLFVCPSIEDSGPMMVNQSIMAGTPVVSFEMGVSQDLVITGETGYRAKLMDSEDLAKGIASVLSLKNTDYEIMCTNCRKIGLDNYSLKVSTDKLLKFIQQDTAY
jgi:glycosyltransferase involved in cell wall biosynthesis